MRVAVAGAGISGLTAAFRLRQAHPAAAITVYEAGDRVGGKLRSAALGGHRIDVGAEAFVGRRPEVPALLAELGLAGRLVHPTGLRPLIWADARAHAMPAGTLMGIPAGPDSLADLVDAPTLAKIAAEPDRPLGWDPACDTDLGSLVGDRFGEQTVARSVDPLLGGVYSGLSSTIGVRAAAPTLAIALDAGASSLSAAVRRALPPPSTAPVFGGIDGSYQVLLDALVAASGAEVRTDCRVSGLHRSASVGGAWTVECADGTTADYDAVVLAVPAFAAAQLLAEHSAAAEELARIDYASSALVSLVVADYAQISSNSGVLAATGEHLQAKAATFTSRKWSHLAGAGLIRVSFGRAGEQIGTMPDSALVAAAVADLGTMLNASIAVTDALVTRWDNGLPQYRPGHLDRVAAITRGVAELDGLEVAGAYLNGVGVPACIASGTAAAARICAGR